MDDVRYEFGLRVPEDVSVMGFDNIAMAAWGSHELSTIEQPANELILATVDILSQLMEYNEQPPFIRRVDMKVIERRSVRNINEPVP